MSNASKTIAGFLKQIHEKPFLSGASLATFDKSLLVETTWSHNDVEKIQKSYFRKDWIVQNGNVLRLPSKPHTPNESIKAKSTPRKVKIFKYYS